MSDEQEQPTWFDNLPNFWQWALILAGLAMAGVAVFELRGTTFAQRLFGDMTCPAYANDIEVMLEQQLEAQVEYFRRSLGNAAVAGFSTDLELRNAKRVEKNPITGELTCTAVSTHYDPTDNTVDRALVTYSISHRQDGESGYFLRVLDQTDIE